MITFFAVLVRFVRDVQAALRDSEFQALFFLVAMTLLSGTIFYRQAEGWGWLDSLYFSVVTLTTIGYGDLSPSTPVSKLFTIFYVFVGIGIVVGFLNAVAKRSVIRRIEKREARRMQDHERESYAGDSPADRDEA